jgi:hypothetical protein
MVSKEEEQALKEYLQGKSEVSRRYHTEATQQPAKHLDEAILAASRKAVATKPRAVTSPFTSNWYVPISLAAVLVLCVGLVFNIYQDSGHELLTAPSPPSSNGGFDQLPAASGRADTVLPSRSLEHDGKGESDGLLYEAEEFRRQEDHKSNQPGFDADIAPAIAPTNEMEDKAMDKITPIPEQSGIETNAAKPGDIEMIWQQKEKQVEETKKSAPDALGAVGGYRASEKSEARKEVFLDAPSEIQSEAAVADETGLAIEEEIEFEDTQIQSREMVVSKLKRSGKDDVADMTPEQWLEHINTLWEKGNKSEAEESLNKFLEVYPDYPRENMLDTYVRYFT